MNPQEEVKQREPVWAPRHPVSGMPLVEARGHLVWYRDDRIYLVPVSFFTKERPLAQFLKDAVYTEIHDLQESEFWERFGPWIDLVEADPTIKIFRKKHVFFSDPELTVCTM